MESKKRKLLPKGEIITKKGNLLPKGVTQEVQIEHYLGDLADEYENSTSENTKRLDAIYMRKLDIFTDECQKDQS